MFIGAFCARIILSEKLYKKENGVIIHDINFYYSYLPATFIEHDPSLHFLDDTTRNFNGRYWHLNAPNGGKVFKMSMGMSYLYSPFFVVGHITALLIGKPADGFSSPYKFFMSFCGLIYMLCGLLLLRLILVRYFNEWTTSLTLLILGLGSNLFFYSVQEGPMSHAPNFFLFSLVLYLTIEWHQEATWKNSILMGLTIGLAALIRPTNVIIALLPLFYNVYSFHSFRGKWQWVLTYYKQLLVIAGCILLPWIPQLLYWKLITGHWFFYSYLSESFFFTNPKILETLFSFRKGLFVYTPIMLFAGFGLFLMRQRLPAFSASIWLFTLLNIYIISSWWCWWYGGSFGLRSYIEMFALWSIPLAITIEKIFRTRMVFKALTLMLLGFFIALNLFQSKQYWNGALHWDGMNYELYKTQFLRRSCAPNYEQLVTLPDYDKAIKGEKEFDWK